MSSAVLKGNAFASTCKNGAYGKVHSVFDKAINIQVYEEDQLLTVVCEDVDIMSACCVAAAPSGSWEKAAKAGDKVLFTPGTVYVENIPIVGNIYAARLWENLSSGEIFALGKPTYAGILAACKVVETYLDKAGKTDTFRIFQLSDFNPVDFIGLGNGLTPSGDDFLAGMLYGVHFFQILYGKSCLWLPKIRGIISQNFHRTGTISRHFLRYAIKGEWGRNTEDFLVALVNSERETLYKTVDRKLSYGASSGADELRGCLFGIREALMDFGA